MALGALTGAGIAKARFMPTAINSTKLGVAAFVVPFFFVFNPSLLLGQTPFGIMTIVQVAFSIIGIICLSCGLYSQLVTKTNLVERVALLICGLAMIYPETFTSIIGIAVLILLILNQKRRVAKAAA